MRKTWGILGLGALLALAGCAGSPTSIAETCGGEEAGISDQGGTLTYMQSLDTTDTAWTCVLRETGASEAEQYTVAQSLDAGNDIGEMEIGGYTVQWTNTTSFGIVLEVSN